MNIKQMLIPTNRTDQRPGRQLNPSAIVIHSTANINSNAYDEAVYVCYNSQRTASYHYVVDDAQIIQVIPDNEMAYHAGNIANLCAIGVELCETGDRQKTLDNGIMLVKLLMDRYNIPIDKIYTHSYFMTKNCPRILIDDNYIKDGLNWHWFVSRLTGDKMVYDTINELPTYYQEPIRWAIDNKILYGDGDSLKLDDALIRALVCLYRYHNIFK